MASGAQRQRQLLILLWMLSLFLVACGTGKQIPITPLIPTTTSTITATVTPTPVPATPTPTPLPLAARINGEALTLAEYQAELSRYQAAQQAAGTKLAPEVDKKLVLDDLIDQVLLAQAANKEGFILDAATFQSRLDQMTAQAGGQQALANWMTAHQFNEQEFQNALRRAIAGAWMRDKIISDVPQAVEQVHARQILLYNSDQANQVLEQIRSGTDFSSLAAKYDPVSAGDLGWFPRGYLTEKAVEEAAFSLKPGEYSPVIATHLGYHILQVIERDPQRQLTPDARQVLQTRALHDWLITRRSQSDIQILLP